MLINSVNSSPKSPANQVSEVVAKKWDHTAGRGGDESKLSKKLQRLVKRQETVKSQIDALSSANSDHHRDTLSNLRVSLQSLEQQIYALKQKLGNEVPGSNVGLEHARKLLAKDPQLSKAYAKITKAYGEGGFQNAIKAAEQLSNHVSALSESQARQFIDVLDGTGLLRGMTEAAFEKINGRPLQDVAPNSNKRRQIMAAFAELTNAAGDANSTRQIASFVVQAMDFKKDMKNSGKGAATQYLEGRAFNEAAYVFPTSEKSKSLNYAISYELRAEKLTYLQYPFDAVSAGTHYHQSAAGQAAGPVRTNARPRQSDTPDADGRGARLNALLEKSPRLAADINRIQIVYGKPGYAGKLATAAEISKIAKNRAPEHAKLLIDALIETGIVEGLGKAAFVLRAGDSPISEALADLASIADDKRRTQRLASTFAKHFGEEEHLALKYPLSARRQIAAVFGDRPESLEFNIALRGEFRKKGLSLPLKFADLSLRYQIDTIKSNYDAVKGGVDYHAKNFAVNIKNLSPFVKGGTKEESIKNIGKMVEAYAKFNPEWPKSNKDFEKNASEVIHLLKTLHRYKDELADIKSIKSQYLNLLVELPRSSSTTVGNNLLAHLLMERGRGERNLLDDVFDPAIWAALGRRSKQFEADMTKVIGATVISSAILFKAYGFEEGIGQIQRSLQEVPHDISWLRDRLQGSLKAVIEHQLESKRQIAIDEKAAKNWREGKRTPPEKNEKRRHVPFGSDSPHSAKLPTERFFKYWGDPKNAGLSFAKSAGMIKEIYEGDYVKTVLHGIELAHDFEDIREDFSKTKGLRYFGRPLQLAGGLSALYQLRAFGERGRDWLDNALDGAAIGGTLATTMTGGLWSIIGVTVTTLAHSGKDLKNYGKLETMSEAGRAMIGAVLNKTNDPTTNEAIHHLVTHDRNERSAIPVIFEVYKTLHKQGKTQETPIDFMRRMVSKGPKFTKLLVDGSIYLKGLDGELPQKIPDSMRSSFGDPLAGARYNTTGTDRVTMPDGSIAKRYNGKRILTGGGLAPFVTVTPLNRRVFPEEMVIAPKSIEGFEVFMERMGAPLEK